MNSAPIKLAVKRLLTERQIRMIISTRSHARSGFCSILSRCIRMLPLSTQGGLTELMSPVGRLDYAAESIRMFVRSSWQHYRLGSCRKEPETVKWIEDNICPGDVFYDVGANVGAYSLVAFCAGDRRSRVYAFEPSYSTFSELCGNVLLNKAQAQVVPLQVGLGEKTGLCQMRFSDVTPGAAEHSWDDGMVAESGGTVYSQSVPCYRMDDLIELLNLEVPSLIKIDVDGSEYDVLRGADRTLSSGKVKSLLVEIERERSAGVINLLKAKGFRLTKEYRRGAKLSNYIFSRGQ